MSTARHRGALAVALVAAAAATASAAPWSFELPAGYTEQPGAGEAELAPLRNAPRTVSADAQVYVSADGAVRLTRMTWLSKFDIAPTRGGLETMDKRIAGGNGRLGRIVSESREVVGDQVIGDQVIDAATMRVHMRRIYAADTEHVVHMFAVVCAGPADRLAECEKAQQSMQLVLPNQAPLAPGPGGAPPLEQTPAERSIAVLVGQIAAGVLVAALALWLVMRRRNR